MSDIVDEMKNWRDERGYPTPGEMLDRAIAEITRLRAEVDRLRAAIDPAASLGSASERDGRHAFMVIEAVAQEADRLGIRAVDVHGNSGSVADFFDKIIRYIKAREGECKALASRLRLTDEEVAFVKLHRERLVWWAHSSKESAAELETVNGLLARLGGAS